MSHLLSKVRWGQPWSKGKHQASRIHSQILIIKYYLMNKIKLNKILFMIASESKIKENYERLQKKKEWDRKGMNKKRFIFEEIRQKEGMNKREYIIDAFCFGHSLFVSAALLHNVCHYLHVPPFSGFLEQNDSANICPHILVEEKTESWLRPTRTSITGNVHHGWQGVVSLTALSLINTRHAPLALCPCPSSPATRRPGATYTAYCPWLPVKTRLG